MARRRSRSGFCEPTPGTPADLTPAADPSSVARAIALRQLAAAPRTRAQLAEALARRDVPDQAAAEVLERFEAVGLLDDAEYARMWVESRHAGRGLARRALEHELRTRGVEPDLARDAAAAVDAEAELRAAITLCRRRLPAMIRDDPARRERRLLGMLARRGYGAGVAVRAVREAVAAEGLTDGGNAADVDARDVDDIVDP